MDYARMGSVIRKRRKALKITQEQLAEMINKSTVYISLIESGARHPSLETLFGIAMSLKTSIDSILLDKSSRKDEEYVDEFAYLLADRGEVEINFIMDVIREVLRHISNGRLSGMKRNGGGQAGQGISGGKGHASRGRDMPGGGDMPSDIDISSDGFDSVVIPTDD